MSGAEIWSLFLSADQDKGVEQFHEVGMYCRGAGFVTSCRFGSVMGRSILELFRLVCVVLVNLLSNE